MEVAGAVSATVADSDSEAGSDSDSEAEMRAESYEPYPSFTGST